MGDMHGTLFTLEYDCTDTFGPRFMDIFKANLTGCRHIAHLSQNAYIVLCQMSTKFRHIGSEVQTFNILDMCRHIQTISQMYGHIQRVQSYSKVKTLPAADSIS